MAFDWFRRQFSDKAQESQADEAAIAQPETDVSEAPAAAEAPVTDAVEPEATTEPEIAADYLTWAQAAYQNIKKRQVTEDAGEEAVSADAVEEIASPPEPLPAVASVAEPIPEPATALVDSGAVLSESESAGLAASNTLPVAIAAEDEVTAELTAEPTLIAETPVAEAESPVAEVPVAPLPFWAQQAETDRLERLERLRETAIAEPEPEISDSTTAAPAPEALEPDFVLDEGFLWSAEILASQGRRPDQISMEEITWLKRLRQGLDKTRRGLINQLRAIVGQGPLNQDAVLEIEAALLQADVGVEATDAIIAALQEKMKTEVLPPDIALQYLKQIIRDLLDNPLGGKKNLTFAPNEDVLNIWLITGVNGAGKTTTIGKLAHIAQKSGYRCLIAAADTFRAAAVEQVKVWGARSGVEVIANPGQNTDPAAVVFDAIAAAQSRGANLLLIDTAGRLQNKKNLMDELSKVRRIIDKKAGNAVVESLLVLDSTLGQNGLRQAQVFSEAAQLSGVVLTKLDGTAKGGIALAVVQQLGLPIRFIGAGEGIEDLRPFSSYEFVEALLNG
jgi:fused signal recognition particle receptor